MPQPLTHYLVLRRAIPEKYWSSWWIPEYKNYFALGTAAPDIFYFPTVPKIVKNIRDDIAWNEIANPLHSNGSYDLFCTLLDVAKLSKNRNSKLANKFFAFAIGYYAHVITDCIFHPYVYRNTDDLWCTTDFSNELSHKKFEYLIDCSLRALYEKTVKFSHIEWACNDNDEIEEDSCTHQHHKLDSQLADYFNKALLKIYPDLYPSEQNPDNIYHPLQQAYDAMIQSIQGLFENKYIILFGARKIIKKLDSCKDTRFFDSPIPKIKILPQHTPRDLFNFSCESVQRVFSAALDYWNNDTARSSNKFFSTPENATNYIGNGNWNLDTGLYCSYNNYMGLREENLSDHFAYKAEQLLEIYQSLKSQYDPNHFPAL